MKAHKMKGINRKIIFLVVFIITVSLLGLSGVNYLISKKELSRSNQIILKNAVESTMVEINRNYRYAEGESKWMSEENAKAASLASINDLTNGPVDGITGGTIAEPEPEPEPEPDATSSSISKGSFTAIVGTSGSGKTTLLNMLGGLDTPTEGTVIIGEKQIHSMNDEQLTIFRRRNIGFVFQNYNLVPILNIYENIMLPSDLDGDTVDKSYFEKIVQLLGLREKLYNMPNQLSGGQQQRVAIARALAGKPAILLADEPTGNLDSKSSANVMEILKQANLSFGQTIVMITHNELLAQMADTVIRIEDGRIAESR